MQIRPVSDLKNRFADIEKIVSDGEPVFLTKNGYGSMVIMSLEYYSKMTDQVELALDEADHFAVEDERRYSHEEVFRNLKCSKIFAQSAESK